MRITVLILLVGLLTLSGCGGSSGGGSAAPEVVDPGPQLDLSFSAAPIDLPDTPAQFVADLAYGEGDRNVLDVFLPDSDTPTPLVIFFHGGGFTGGDKSFAYDVYAADIREFLGAGIAYATVNYHLLSAEPPLDPDGVIRPLRDGARALQFARYYANSLNIDPEQVVTYGVSAGASMSLWLATHDDSADPNNEDPVLQQSTRVNAIAALFTQSTLNIVRWQEVLAPILDPLAPVLGGSTEITVVAAALGATDFLYTILGVTSDEEIFGEENIAYRANIDFLELMDSGDAPIYAFNANEPFRDSFVNLFLHHTLHTLALQQRAEAVGLENVIYAIDPVYGIEDPSGEGRISFLMRHLL
ncbi:MAG: alpha/beta hydrolase fold domain-containing protein [Halioglobus sp.]